MNQANPYTPPAAAAFAAAPEHGPLREMPLKELKKLYGYSQTIRTISILWIIGVVVEIVVAGIAVSNGHVVGALIYLAIAALQVPAAIGCIKRTPWGRTCGMVLSSIGLIGFPIGTLISIIVLIALTKGASLFGPDRIHHRDLKSEVKFRKQNPGI